MMATSTPWSRDAVLAYLLQVFAGSVYLRHSSAHIFHDYERGALEHRCYYHDVLAMLSLGLYLAFDHLTTIHVDFYVYFRTRTTRPSHNL